MDAKDPAQQAPKNAGGLYHHDFHAFSSSLPLPLQTAHAAGDQQHGHQKQQCAYRKDRRDQDPGTQRHRKNTQQMAAASAKHITRPLSATSIAPAVVPCAEISKEKKKDRASHETRS